MEWLRVDEGSQPEKVQIFTFRRPKKREKNKKCLMASFTILCHAATPFTASWHNGSLVVHHGCLDSDNAGSCTNDNKNPKFSSFLESSTL